MSEQMKISYDIKTVTLLPLGVDRFYIFLKIRKLLFIS